MIRMGVAGTRELQTVTRRLERAASGTAGTRARRNLVRAAKPVVRQVRAAAKAVQVGSTRGGTARPDTSTQLRARAAAATDSAATAHGVVLFVAGWKVGPDGTRLAQYLDTEDLPRWRHPVFGHTAVWVTQTGAPYFYVTVRAAEPRFAAAVEDAMATTAKETCV